MRNWSGTFEYAAAEIAEPTSLEELCGIVARADRVRALGTRHSFNPIADTPGVLVTPTAIEPVFALDEGSRRVTVGAGTRYAALAAWLTERGWALHNLGSLPHISVGGATATATHGSGEGNGNLATAVRGIELVGPDGTASWIRQGDPDFAGAVVHLGLLGVVTRLELAVQPSYLVRQDVYRGLPWDALLDDPDRVLGAAYSVSVFTDWVEDEIQQVWVKRRVEPGEGDAVPDDLLGAARDTSGRVQIIDGADDNTTAQGVVGPWSAHLPHFRIDSTPSDGDEIQTEYFVPLEQAADAIRAVRVLGEDIAPRLLITELRTIAADDLWLSTASGRDSLAIHFTWRNEPAAVVPLCTRIEQALQPFAPRPHWGKVHTMRPGEIADRYPRLPDFRELVARRDPAGKFASPMLADLMSPALSTAAGA